jgi:hypothetical protein
VRINGGNSTPARCVIGVGPRQCGHLVPSQLQGIDDRRTDRPDTANTNTFKLASLQVCKFASLQVCKFASLHTLALRVAANTASDTVSAAGCPHQFGLKRFS